VKRPKLSWEQSSGARGIFNGSDTPMEHDVIAFGKAEPVKRDGLHSAILKNDGENSFAQRGEKLQSK